MFIVDDYEHDFGFPQVKPPGSGARLHALNHLLSMNHKNRRAKWPTILFLQAFLVNIKQLLITEFKPR